MRTLSMVIPLMVMINNASVLVIQDLKLVSQLLKDVHSKVRNASALVLFTMEPKNAHMKRILTLSWK